MSMEKPKLILALDTDNVAKAEMMVAKVEGEISFFKIGLELIYAGGLSLAHELHQQGFETFIDVKLHDIGHQVEHAAARIGALGASLMTVHAYPKTMKAACAGLAGSETKVLAVTVLTSFDDNDVMDAGYRMKANDLVIHRLHQAEAMGVGGVVCSAQEAGDAKRILSHDRLIVTPGIRLKGDEVGDQVRVATPAFAAKSGASHLVVGRPIYQSEDPKATARRIKEDMIEQS